ncbi:MAG: MGMT family protein [Gammaproteobacteria bacterium]|nr:MGMT family protein [Gammaproteobacteria bacterium]
MKTSNHLPMDTPGRQPTEASVNLRQRIWQVTAEIPRGAVATYGQVAELAGLPGGARQVGLTLSQLPPGTKLPWHRVINAAGRISIADASRQQALLESEGVVFEDGRVNLKRFRWRMG